MFFLPLLFTAKNGDSEEQVQTFALENISLHFQHAKVSQTSSVDGGSSMALSGGG